MKPKPIVWTLAQARATIAGLQSTVRPLGFHIALAGGVLNAGESRKDLDLVVLPLCGREEFPDYDQLRLVLWQAWGPGQDIGAEVPAEYLETHPYRDRWTFANKGHRVDVFVVGVKEEG